MPMDLLFGKAPKMHRDTAHPAPTRWPKLDLPQLDLREAGLRVLAHPTVASKNFLVTIGDRTVGGLCARDQMVGPWQLPLADCAITLTDFHGFAGEAMAIGERTPLALLDAAASARMAVGEAITNLAAAPVASLSEVKLSANWMAAASATRARTRCCTTRCARSAWNCARNSTSASRSARTRCRCRRAGRQRRRDAADRSRRCRWSSAPSRASPTCARS